MARVMNWAELDDDAFEPEDQLDALRWNWGSAYEIETDGDTWKARRRDGMEGWITAPDPDTLRNAIVSDYTLKPGRLADGGELPS